MRGLIALIALVVCCTGAVADGDIGRRCGSGDFLFNGGRCGPDQFCESRMPGCTAYSWTGRCVPLTQECPEKSQPVCGCDRQTYVNDCARRRALVQKAHDGFCKGGLRAQAEQEKLVSSQRPASKLDGNHSRTRFIVGLPRQAKYEVFALNNPYRVVVDLDETRLRLPAQPKGKAIGLIKVFRAGLSAKDRSRIVIEVAEPVVVASAKMEQAEGGKGHNLVIEMVSVAAAP